ncbi:methyltransferase domain-containing protein [Variovorax boronicumulans]|uniref:methyltransferase domain-containing protein n=1 Tax=Variovorax boronicumulans TaxID=436515 RepID=UPI0027D7D4B6|nr:methyltransferase domain-containing protein [Variovorax boronicumulans]
MSTSPRDRIGLLLSGDVLEIGPGSRPFAVAPGANVQYADRAVEGKRDENWPELIGQPAGVQAHHDLNLDTDGLAVIESSSLDGVVASHVIEHVANPLGVIAEFGRALRFGGKLLLVVPDRHQTFDAPRRATPFSTVLAKQREKTTEVDEASIRDFCQAIYGQPPIHPPKVREWHDPTKLDADRLALHRRRSIHVHVWSPEEFASLIVCSMLDGSTAWRLESMYFSDHFPDRTADEFAFVLEKVPLASPNKLGRQFVDAWCHSVLDDTAVDSVRLARFEEALRRDCAEAAINSLPLQLFAAKHAALGMAAAQDRNTSLEVELKRAQIRAAEAIARAKALELSTSWKVTAPLRAVRRLFR